MKKLISLGAVALALASASCVWVTPQTPANMAIRIVSAMQIGDVEEIEWLMCEAIAAPVDLEDVTTLGPLQPVYELAGARTAYGGASEYSPSESLDIPVDVAWTEIDFIGSSELEREVWRFHMVREGGVWKVCSVEPRPDSPLPPADIDVVDLAAVQALARLDATTPEDVRSTLLQDHSSSDANSRCSIEDDDPQTAWSVVATGLWPEQQPNGAYLITYIETTSDLSRWRAYTIHDCEIRVVYP